MNKILVEIICAATAKSYDFWIPKKMPVSLIIEKIVADICLFEVNDALFDDEKGIYLYSYEQGLFLNRAQTLLEAGVKAGDRLLII
ncbi:secretion system protein YukD [Eubacterium limosum]|nr:secretion system protein YukD [Eubacterium limosum]